MKLYKTTIITFLLLLGQIWTFAQNDHNIEIPRAFLVGEYEKAYSQIMKNYPASLINASKDSVDLAYINWMYLLYDIENFSKKIDFDIKGIKIWINVFWNKSGKIDFITYYPKPNSKNMEFDKLTAFFSEFVKNYKPRYKYSENFSHFGSAKFPSFAERFIQKE